MPSKKIILQRLGELKSQIKKLEEDINEHYVKDIKKTDNDYNLIQYGREQSKKEALEDEIKFLENHIINLENFVEDYWHNERTDYRAMLIQIINELKGRLETLKEKK